MRACVGCRDADPVELIEGVPFHVTQHRPRPTSRREKVKCMTPTDQEADVTEQP